MCVQYSVQGIKFVYLDAANRYFIVYAGGFTIFIVNVLLNTWTRMVIL